jgi:hypothetical protein
MKKVITAGRFTKVYESNGRFTKVYIGEGGGRFTKVHEANGDTLLVPQQEHRAASRSTERTEGRTTL